MITSTTPALRLRLHRAGLGPGLDPGSSQHSNRWATNQPSGTTTARQARTSCSIPPGDILQSPDPTPYPTLPSRVEACGAYHVSPRQSQPCTAGSFDIFGLTGSRCSRLPPGYQVLYPPVRLPLDPEISGPTPFSRAQIPPSRGRLGRHTETTMSVPLDQLWSPSPPCPLSGGVGPRFPQGTPLT